jgi:nitrate reductase beta subunit
MLYDADRIQEAASVPAEQDLYQAHLDLFLDPFDPAVVEAARNEGIPDSWLDAAKASPVYKLAIDWKLALPLHPEYRTLPMVWYVPPLSPIQSAAERGRIGMSGELPDVASLRIPLRYLANLLTAGDEAPVVRALERMMAMRAWRRARNVDGMEDTKVLEQAGLTPAQAEDMYRYLAIANYEDRFVIPTAHREYANDAYGERGGCGFTFGNGCSGDSPADLFGARRITTYAVPPPRQEKEHAEEVAP